MSYSGNPGIGFPENAFRGSLFSKDSDKKSKRWAADDQLLEPATNFGPGGLEPASPDRNRTQFDKLLHGSTSMNENRQRSSRLSWTQ